MINYLKKILEAIKAFFTKEKTTLIEEFKKIEAEAKAVEAEVTAEAKAVEAEVTAEVKKVVSREKKTDGSK
jgi:hypothetical protein